MLTPEQQAEEIRLKARVNFARSEYLRALATHENPCAREVLETLCFLRSEESELQGFYFDMKEGNRPKTAVRNSKRGSHNTNQKRNTNK